MISGDDPWRQSSANAKSKRFNGVPSGSISTQGGSPTQSASVDARSASVQRALGGSHRCMSVFFSSVIINLSLSLSLSLSLYRERERERERERGLL